MAVTKETVYIKGEQNVEVTKSEVTLGDILSIECANPEMIPKIKALKLLKMQDDGKHRYVVSILKIIECIHRQYPNVDIENMGKEDIIITCENQKRRINVCIGQKLSLSPRLRLSERHFPLWRLITMWKQRNYSADLYITYGKTKQWFHRFGIDVLCRTDCRNTRFLQSFRREEIQCRSDTDGGGNAVI